MIPDPDARNAQQPRSPYVPCPPIPLPRAVVVKTVRLSDGVSAADGLAPDSLVLHLVRDPRGVTHSKIKTFKKMKIDVPNDADNVDKARAVGLA